MSKIPGFFPARERAMDWKIQEIDIFFLAVSLLLLLLWYCLDRSDRKNQPWSLRAGATNFPPLLEAVK